MGTVGNALQAYAGVAQPAAEKVELHDRLLHPIAALQLKHGVNQVVPVTDTFDAFRAWHAGGGEDSAAAALRPQGRQGGIGAVHRDPQPQGELRLGLRGDEGQEHTAPITDQCS